MTWKQRPVDLVSQTPQQPRGQRDDGPPGFPSSVERPAPLSLWGWRLDIAALEQVIEPADAIPAITVSLE
jgi:hypothetical protein